jgi:hypothetical protein
MVSGPFLVKKFVLGFYGGRQELELAVLPLTKAHPNVYDPQWRLELSRLCCHMLFCMSLVRTSLNGLPYIAGSTTIS